MKKGSKWLIVTVLLILGGIGADSLLRFVKTEPAQELAPHFNCILDIGAIQDTTYALLTGYHYNLLQKFAKDNGKTVDISLSNLDVSPYDSLLQGSADLIVLPIADALLLDSTICSVPIGGKVVWMMKQDKEAEMVTANLWLGGHLESPEDSVDKVRFWHQFGYRHSGYSGFISPYDSLMKVHADSLGWDWRMLASIIYLESWFHIESRSYRGAEGLLQLMPATAARFGSGNTLDPEQSIMTGARYLEKLGSRYKKLAKDRMEWFKYTAAAYNAGEGRIDDCIKYTEYRGQDPSLWANVEQLIPEMRNDSIIQTGAVRLGVFKGYETIAYVEQAVRVYDKICTLCPE